MPKSRPGAKSLPGKRIFCKRTITLRRKDITSSEHRPGNVWQQRLPRKNNSLPGHNFVNMNIVTQYPAECGKNFLYLRCSLEGTLHIFDESVKLLSSDRNLANSNTRRKGNLHSSLFWLDVRSPHSYHRVWGIVYFVSGFARTSIRMSFGPTLSALR